MFYGGSGEVLRKLYEEDEKKKKLAEGMAAKPAAAAPAVAAAPAATEAAAPAAAASGMGWGQVGALAGAEALTGVLKMMHEQELAKKKAMQEALEMKMKVTSDNGQNQQAMLQNMIENYRQSLGGI